MQFVPYYTTKPITTVPIVPGRVIITPDGSIYVDTPESNRISASAVQYVATLVELQLLEKSPAHLYVAEGTLYQYENGQLVPLGVTAEEVAEMINGLITGTQTFTGTWAECQVFIDKVRIIEGAVTLKPIEPLTQDPTVTVAGLTVRGIMGNGSLRIDLQGGSQWRGTVENLSFQNCTTDITCISGWANLTRVRTLAISNARVWAECLRNATVSVTNQSFLLYSYCLTNTLTVQEGSICELQDRSGAQTYSGRGKIQRRAANTNQAYSAGFSNFQGWVEDQTPNAKTNTFRKQVQPAPEPVMLSLTPTTNSIIVGNAILTYTGDKTLFPTETGTCRYGVNTSFVEISTTPGNLWIVDEHKRTDWCVAGVWQATVTHNCLANANDMRWVSSSGILDPLIANIRSSWNWANVPVQSRAEPLIGADLEAFETTLRESLENERLLRERFLSQADADLLDPTTLPVGTVINIY